MLRVRESKRGYHETAIPTSLAEAIKTAADYGDLRVDEPIVDRHPETIQRWVDEAAQNVQSKRENEDWQYVSAHDCRRTWATYTYYAFGANEVALDAVCQFGGWSDVETVRTNYIGRVPDELVVNMMDDAGLL
jgi:integrase